MELIEYYYWYNYKFGIPEYLLFIILLFIICFWYKFPNWIHSRIIINIIIYEIIHNIYIIFLFILFWFIWFNVCIAFKFDLFNKSFLFLKFIFWLFNNWHVFSCFCLLLFFKDNLLSINFKLSSVSFYSRINFLLFLHLLKSFSIIEFCSDLVPFSIKFIVYFLFIYKWYFLFIVEKFLIYILFDLLFK